MEHKRCQSTRVQEVFFDVLASRSSLQAPFPCIWIKCSSKDFLQTYEICLRASLENGSSLWLLPRQYLCSIQDEGTDDKPYPINDSTLGNIGFFDQQGEGLAIQDVEYLS